MEMKEKFSIKHKVQNTILHDIECLFKFDAPSNRLLFWMANGKLSEGGGDGSDGV